MQRVRGKRQAKNLKKKLSTKNNTILFAKKNTCLLTSLPAAEREKKISSSPHYLWQRGKKKILLASLPVAEGKRRAQ